MKSYLLFLTLAAAMMLADTCAGQSYQQGYYLNMRGQRVTGYLRDNLSVASRTIRYRPQARQGGDLILPLDSILEVRIGDKPLWKAHSAFVTNVEHRILTQKVVEAPIALFQGRLPNLGLVYFWHEGGRHIQISRNTFNGFLRRAREECTLIPTEKKYTFSQENLIELTSLYNRCRSSDAQVVSLASPVSRALFVGLKPYWNYGNLNLKPGTHYGLGEYSGFSHPSLALSLFWEFSPLFGLVGEPGYLRQRIASDYVNITPVSEQNTYSEVEIDARYLELPLGLQFRPLRGRISPFLEGGVYIGLPLKRELLDEFFTSNPANIPSNPSSNVFEELNWGFLGGVGISARLSERLLGQVSARYVFADCFLRTYASIYDGGQQFSTVNTEKWEGGLRLLWRLGK